MRMVLFRWLVALLATTVIVVSLEGICWWLNRGHDEERPLFWVGSPGEGGQTAAAPGPVHPVLSDLDPHLGFAHDAEALRRRGFRLEGGVLVHRKRPAGPNTLRLAVLGGSTSDGALFGHSWPAELQGLLDAAQIDAVVYNAAVGSFSTHQELIRLVRDVLPLKPHLVLSYSGANEQDSVVPNTPMVHPYQRRLMRFVLRQSNPRLLPNVAVALRRLWGRPSVSGVYYGAQNSTPPAGRWQRNVTLMHALCQASGVGYLALVQPVLGQGAYRPNLAERQIQRTSRRKFAYGLFYEQLRHSAADLAFAVDFTDVFAGQSGLYVDDCHVTRQGNRRVARAVLELLRQRGLLTPRGAAAAERGELSVKKSGAEPGLSPPEGTAASRRPEPAG